MRDVTIVTIDADPESIDGAWKEVVGDRELLSLTGAQFGFAEEVISLLRFKDGTFEVGIGESLRPYDRLYCGDNESYAEDRFWMAVTRHTREM